MTIRGIICINVANCRGIYCGYPLHLSGNNMKNVQTEIFKPNKWIAGLLGFLFHWLGLLYVVRPKWAVFYFFLEVVTTLILLALLFYYQLEWLAYTSPGYILPVVCAIHAFRLASRTGGIVDRPWYSRWYGLVSIPLSIVLCAFLFRAFLFEPFRMPASSMTPTIKAGAHMVVSKFSFGNYQAFDITLLKKPATKKISRSDIIVFDYPENKSVKFVKRVIGVPGDRVQYIDKRLFINGEAVPSEVVADESEFEIVEERLDGNVYRVKNVNSAPPRDFETVVPDKHYFVMGDNRDNSRDSRYWGFVPAENLVGKLIYILQPPSRGR